MGTPSPLEQRQAIADELAPVALELAERVRHDDPDVLDADVLERLSRFQLKCLCLLLAAAGDTSVSPDIWWGWVRFRDAIDHPSPIMWADDEVRIEDMTSEQINGLIARLARDHHKRDDEIAEVVRLSPGAVAKRRERAGIPAGLRRGDVRTARAGVAG
jgi:hypothetical protein